jgi:hypothetical protein
VTRLRLCRLPVPLTRLQDPPEMYFANLYALPLDGAAVTIRFSDQYPSLREVDGLSDTAFRLHISAFFWIALNRTDGLIRQEDLELVCARVRASERFAAECVQRGAWHDARHDCGSEHCLGPVDVDGWTVHDYLKDNPSAAELEAAESGKSQGGKRGNHKRWHADKGKRAPGCEFCEAPEAREAAPRKPPPKRTSHIRSHTDRISDSHPTRIGDPERKPQVGDSATSRLSHAGAGADFDSDFDLNPDQVSQSGVVNADAREPDPPPGSPGFRIRVIAEFAEAHRTEIDDGTADALAAEVLGKAREPVPNPLGYVLKAIANEHDPYGRWLPKRPARTSFAEPRPHCGDRLCSPATRRREHPETADDDGPCPKCSGSAATWKAS